MPSFAVPLIFNPQNIFYHMCCSIGVFIKHFLLKETDHYSFRVCKTSISNKQIKH